MKLKWLPTCDFEAKFRRYALCDLASKLAQVWITTFPSLRCDPKCWSCSDLVYEHYACVIRPFPIAVLFYSTPLFKILHILSLHFSRNFLTCIPCLNGYNPVLKEFIELTRKNEKINFRGYRTHSPFVKVDLYVKIFACCTLCSFLNSEMLKYKVEFSLRSQRQ